jgi:hypothetical protein
MPVTKVRRLPELLLTPAEATMANNAWQMLFAMRSFEMYPYRMEMVIRAIQSHPLYPQTTLKRAKIMALDIMLRHIKGHTKERLRDFNKEMDDILDDDLNLIESTDYVYYYFCINWNHLWKTGYQLGRYVA